MKFPAIALESYQRLKSNPIFLAITDYVLRTLRSEKNAGERARFVHNLVDEFNKETLSHPLIAQLSPCKKGCAACCHTEVSATPDEVEILAEKVQDGLPIDLTRLHIQKSAADQNKSFYTIPYELRACVFLGEDNQCRVYEDRPSVCRTNVVLGDAEQCSTTDGVMKDQRLLKTEKSDMAIMGLFMQQPEANDILPNLLWKKLNSISVKPRKINKEKSKYISKD